MSKVARRKVYDFLGATTPPASADGGPWLKADTSSSGAPTMTTATGGTLDLTLASTSEVENLCLYWGDKLSLDIDELLRVEILASITASVDSSVTATFGVASARADDTDALAAAALFKLAGSNTVVVETDDGTNDNDDTATGLTLTTTLRRCVIDFAGGVQTVGPPTASRGGKGNVLFSMENASGVLAPVARSTAFDMSNYSGGLQLFAQLSKTASTEVPVLSIAEFVVDYTVGT